jgi:hypothetical protein
MIETKKENVYTDIEGIIEIANEQFIKTAESIDTDEKLMLEFFREKYIHFVLYSLFKKKGWNVRSEWPTKWKFIVTGKTPQSGNHDIVLFDRNEKPVAIFEFYLGFDVGEKNLDSSDFKKHLDKDYKKLINSDLCEVYILNYFYKGKSERSSPNRSARKEKSYQEHFSLCVSACNELAKEHKASNLNIKVGLWIVEARDDTAVT